MNKLVYIVILNYRNWSDVKECISSIIVSTYNNYKIIVLDNPSGDDSVHQLESWINTERIWEKMSVGSENFLAVYPEQQLDESIIDRLARITLVQNLKNEGFAAGNNVILRYLVNEDAYIWLLNPDMIVDRQAMAELVNYTSLQPPRTITGAVLKKYENPSEIYLYGGGRINWRTATITFIQNPADLDQIDYLNGSCIFLHASHFKSLGLLPTKYFLYWEETAWCFNAKKAGYSIRVCMTAICYDKISATIGKTFLSDFYYTRNGLLFVAEYSKRNLIYAKFSTLLRIMRRVISGEFDRAKGTLSGLAAFRKMEQHED